MSRNIYGMRFAKIYTLYLQKVEKKGRMQSELDAVIFWLTGHDELSLNQVLESNTTVSEFFSTFPKLNENASLIRGMVCKIRVEDITDPLIQKMRYLDKLVDELAMGKALEKIFRR